MLSKAVLVAVLAVWSIAFVIVGLFTMLVWPLSTQQLSSQYGLRLGLPLLLMGLFVAAVTADKVFPGANQRITTLFLLGPWVIFGGLLVAFFGGMI